MNNKIFFYIIILIISVLYIGKKIYHFSQKQSLSILAWTNSINYDIIKKFEEKYNVTIHIKSYTNNEELLSKLQLSKEKIDIIFPSDFIIPELLKLKLIKPINIKKINEFELLDQDNFAPIYFNKQYYGIPSQWNVVGIGITEKIKKLIHDDPIAIYKAFFDGYYKNKKLKIAQISELILLINVVYHYYKNIFLKNRICIKNNLLTIILEILKKQKDSILAYTEDLSLDLFNYDILDMVLLESDVFLYIANQLPEKKLDFILFPNFIIKIVEYFSISSKSENEDLCYKFINFSLKEEQLLIKKNNNLSFAPKQNFLKKYSNKNEKKILEAIEKNNKNIYRASKILNKKDIIELLINLKR